MFVCVTDCKAHTQRHISDGVDAAVNGGMTDVDQVTHDGHHGGVHHTCRSNITQLHIMISFIVLLLISVSVLMVTYSEAQTSVWSNQTVDTRRKRNLQHIKTTG